MVTVGMLTVTCGFRALPRQLPEIPDATLHDAPVAWGCGRPRVAPPAPAQLPCVRSRDARAQAADAPQALRAHGIHPSQAFCLREVAHHDGITQRDLADLLCIARPTLTVMLQKMEKAGLVERRTEPSDQRFTHIHLTPAGIETHLTMHSVLDEVVAQVIGPLGDADQAELVRLLGLLHDNIVAAMDAQPASPDDAPIDPPTE